MVFQHFSLFEALTVAENIALALSDAPGMAELKTKITGVSAEYGLPLNPDSVVADLSVGERQRVEIVRCLLQEPELIIMDEPTSVLTPQEADDLFVTLKRLASEGVSVLYISHRLEEVRAICHHATILRHGKVVAECDPQKETAARLASLMVGAELRQVSAPPAAGADAPVRLAVNDLSLPEAAPVRGRPRRCLARGARRRDRLDRRRRRQRARTSCSTRSRASASQSARRHRHRRQPCGRRGVNARRKLNAAFVPEERLGHGAVPRFKLSENVVLTRHGTGEGWSGR